MKEAYPNLPIDECLRLASTHWRIPLYYPSFKTGGYCIPLSSKYILMGASNRSYLTIAKDAVEYDDYDSIKSVFDLIARYYDAQCNICLLGISYKGDLKVHQLSPSLPIINAYKNSGHFMVNDPYYTKEEVENKFGCQYIDLEELFSSKTDLNIKIIVIVSDHKVYKRIPRQWICDLGVKCIIDNYGIWAKYREFFNKNNINYYKPGDGQWKK